MNERPVNLETFGSEFWKSYEASDPGVWKGREVADDLPPQYIYQMVRRIDLRDELKPWEETGGGPIPPALIGYCCDEGVTRNQGRPGALAGPFALRSALALFAVHGSHREIWDLGDLHCVQGRMENCQDALASLLALFWSEGFQPLVMGGGHDIAYGHFKGFFTGLSGRLKGRQPKLGILNLDAHFDLRKPEPQAHSGSPFHQILLEYNGRVSYAVLGIQTSSNTEELFGYARRFGVYFREAGDCRAESWEVVVQELNAWVSGLDGLYLTIDLDGFSSAYAPGVSAPSPLGLTPDFALDIVDWAYESGLPVALDIAELNPEFDRDGATARLGAQLLARVLRITGRG